MANHALDPGDRILRATQRAPRACTTCSRRRVKCNRLIPCDECIRRGVANTCEREVVLVRGQATTAQEPISQPSYHDLVKENRDLKFRLSGPGLISPLIHEFRSWGVDDHWEELIYSELKPSAAHVQLSWPHFLLPSRQLSTRLLHHDKLWNSWVHYGLQYPDFEHEHESFWTSIKSAEDIAYHDPFWLAIYFAMLSASMLSIGESDLEGLQLPETDGEDDLAETWYATSLLCLNRADYLRKHDVRTVQTIVILGTCFLNFGDVGLSRVLWSCAIRIAQSLGLDGRTVPDSIGLNEETCHRMWWTLIIVEWLSGPRQKPCITEQDFDVPLPALVPEGAMSLHSNRWNCYPVQYHIAMIRISSVFQRFRQLLRANTPIAEAVQDADNHFATIIDELPPHLQPDETQNDSTRERNLNYPWIPWQHGDLRLVLLHHRLAINRLLQREWANFPERLRGPRSVCLSSALGVLAVCRNWDMPMERRKQWALSTHLYSAVIFLIAESTSRYAQEINHGIALLELVQSRNEVAKKAAEILRRLIAI